MQKDTLKITDAKKTLQVEMNANSVLFSLKAIKCIMFILSRRLWLKIILVASVYVSRREGRAEEEGAEDERDERVKEMIHLNLEVSMDRWSEGEMSRRM